MKPEIFYSRCLSGVVQYKLKRTPIKKKKQNCKLESVHEKKKVALLNP
jgi:hypothetical protein